MAEKKRDYQWAYKINLIRQKEFISPPFSLNELYADEILKGVISQQTVLNEDFFGHGACDSTAKGK